LGCWMGLIRATAVILVLLTILLGLNAVVVWADTFTPNPPVAGQGFTISGTGVSTWELWAIGCGVGTVYASGIDYGFIGSPFTDIIPALHAGTYGFLHSYDTCDTFSVTNASPTTTVTCLASTLNVGQMTTCIASLSNPACFSPATCLGPSTSVPETVSWSDAGSVSFSSSTCTISTGTSCSVTVTGTGAGAASVKGSYAGDGDNNPSSGTFPLTINGASSTSPPSSYIPVTIGGTMLPINRLQVILPWLTLIAALSTLVAYTLTASRKTTKRK